MDNLKYCSRCKLNKNIKEFTKNKARKDGLCDWCVTCNKEARKIYSENNKEQILERNRQKRLNNLEYHREKDRKDYYKNLEKCQQQSLKYYYKNREKQIENNREYKRKNKEILAEKKKEYDKNYRERRTEIMKQRQKTDIQYKLKTALRSRINRALKAQKGLKYEKSLNLIGCSIEFLKQHIESQFEPWMTWENHGFRGWHIDHIKPCFQFDLTDPAQQKECFRYTNMRPLHWKENITRIYDKKPSLEPHMSYDHIGPLAPGKTKIPTSQP